MGEFAQEWLATIEATVRPATLDKYRRDLRTHVGFVPLAKLDGPALNRLWAQLAVSGKNRACPDGPRTGLSSKSVQNVAMTVHRMLKDAVRWGRIARNPADMSDPPRSATRTPIVKAWTAATLRTFLELTRGDELWALWLVMATTGLRRGEALGLRWADIDFDTGRVRVTRTVTTIGWEIHHGQPKTAAGRRPVALDSATVATRTSTRRQSPSASKPDIALLQIIGKGNKSAGVSLVPRTA